MSRPLLTTLCVISTVFAAPDDPVPARAKTINIRHDAGQGTIVVSGIDPENLAALAMVDWDAERWAEVLSLTVGSNKAKPLPIAGTYRVVEDLLRFKPRFPLEPGVVYLAKFDLSRLPAARGSRTSVLIIRMPDWNKPAPTVVARVEPSGDVLPENLLKFYIHFSAPMSRGEVYERVRLTDEAGRAVEGAFLRIGEELWDNSGTRITLLLDPGRIKRGLRPREEDGPILSAGKTYSLFVDRGWPDAAGQPLRESYQKTFRAGPARMRQLDPANWTITTPERSTKTPLVVTFPDPLDRAMLDHALVLLDSRGTKVAGRASVGEGAHCWRFAPDESWKPGTYQLEIDSDLEDLAGNSLSRAFEVDVEGPVRARNEARRERVTITISLPSRP